MSDNDDAAADASWAEYWIDQKNERIAALERELTAARAELETYRDSCAAKADRIDRLGETVVKLRAEVEALRAERDNARARVDRAVQILTRVHSLMYPAPVKMPDGRTMAFRPKSLDPHEVLQELSDRIRAIPDELDALAKEKA